MIAMTATQALIAAKACGTVTQVSTFRNGDVLVTLVINGKSFGNVRIPAHLIAQTAAA